MSKPKGLTYRESGVDIDYDDAFVERISGLVRSTYGPQVVENKDGFAGLFSLKGTVGLFMRSLRDPLLVGCTDGVGTKLKVAFDAGVHHTIGIDLVAMNVNDLIVVGAEPLFFLDYIGGSHITNEVRVDIIRGVVTGCHESGMALLGGETASLPDLYKRGEYDLAGTAVGIVERSRWIRGQHIEPGDVAIGLYSTGLHSNGYSLARNALLTTKGYALTDAPVELGGPTLAEELLRPTRIYVQAVRAVLSHYRKKYCLKGIAHITGSGLPGNVPRILPEGCAVRIETKRWTPPPIFDLIRRAGDIEREEMFRTFNMGIGLVMICAPLYVDVIRRLLKRNGYSSVVIGSVVPGKQTVEIV